MQLQWEGNVGVRRESYLNQLKCYEPPPHLDMKVENNYVQSKKKPVTFDSRKKVNQINCMAPSW